MNERLKELSRQSVYYDEDEESWEFDREKFAELIVQECAQISEEDVVGDDPACCTNTAHRIARTIKKHFGVE